MPTTKLNLNLNSYFFKKIFLVICECIVCVFKYKLICYRELYGGRKVLLNPAWSVPHDLGDPEDEPFDRCNAYRIHDVSQWKDLSLKFVVAAWRDAVLLPARAKEESVKRAAELLARAAWPVCENVMERALGWDGDGDGLIENSGRPDQTYDTWCMRGASSYCNSLWLAALRAHLAMAKKLGKDGEEGVQRLKETLDKAQEAFNAKYGRLHLQTHTISKLFFDF